MKGVQPGSHIARILDALPRVGGISYARLLAKVNSDPNLPEVEPKNFSASLSQAIKRHHYVKRVGCSVRNYTYERDQPAEMAHAPKKAWPKRVRTRAAKGAAPAPAKSRKAEPVPEFVAEDESVFAFVPRMQVAPRVRIELPERQLCKLCDTFGPDPDCEDCIRPWRRAKAA